MMSSSIREAFERAASSGTGTDFDARSIVVKGIRRRRARQTLAAISVVCVSALVGAWVTSSVRQEQKIPPLSGIGVERPVDRYVLPGAPSAVIDTSGGSSWVTSSDGRGGFELHRLDPQTTEIAATVSLPGFPLDVDSSEGSVLVLTRSPKDDSSEITMFDRSGSVASNYPVEKGTQAFAVTGGRVWTVGKNGTNVYDSFTGSVVSSTPDPFDFISAEDGEVWAGRVAGALDHLDPVSARSIGSTTVPKNLVGMTVDTGFVWAMSQTPSGGMLLTKLGADGYEQQSVSIELGPGGFAVTGGSVWIPVNGASEEGGEGLVVRVDKGAMSVTETIEVGSAPVSVASDGVSLWIANFGDSDVLRYEGLEP